MGGKVSLHINSDKTTTKQKTSIGKQIDIAIVDLEASAASFCSMILIKLVSVLASTKAAETEIISGIKFIANDG